MVLLLFAVRSAPAAVSACQMPIGGGTVARTPPLPHCVGDGGYRGITAIALFADENGRNESPETAVERPV